MKKGVFAAVIFAILAVIAAFIIKNHQDHQDN